MIPIETYSKLMENALPENVKKATCYISDKEVVKVTRVGKLDRRNPTRHYVLTIGRPNYAERGFIKLLKKAGEPFPVKAVQIKFDKNHPNKASGKAKK